MSFKPSSGLINVCVESDSLKSLKGLRHHLTSLCIDDFDRGQAFPGRSEVRSFLKRHDGKSRVKVFLFCPIRDDCFAGICVKALGCLSVLIEVLID